MKNSPSSGRRSLSENFHNDTGTVLHQLSRSETFLSSVRFVPHHHQHVIDHPSSPMLYHSHLSPTPPHHSYPLRTSYLNRLSTSQPSSIIIRSPSYISQHSSYIIDHHFSSSSPRHHLSSLIISLIAHPPLIFASSSSSYIIAQLSSLTIYHHHFSSLIARHNLTLSSSILISCSKMGTWLLRASRPFVAAPTSTPWRAMGKGNGLVARVETLTGWLKTPTTKRPRYRAKELHPVPLPASCA